MMEWNSPLAHEPERMPPELNPAMKRSAAAVTIAFGVAAALIVAFVVLSSVWGMD